MTGSNPGSEKDIWAPDPDPWYAAIEDAYFALGMTFIHKVMEELGRESLAKAEDRARALERAEEIYRTALAGYDRLPPSQYRKLAEAITEKWYGEGRLETRAERRSVAAYLLGLLRSGRRVGLDWRGLLGEREKERLAYIAARGAEFIRRLADEVRHRVAKVLLLWHESPTASPEDLGKRLQEEMGVVARDWRRVALTEVAHARTAGYLMGLPEGAIVEWSAAPDACPVCRKMHGRRFRVRHSPGDPQREVWPEKGWQDGPSIPAHPHCRCRFIAVTQPVGEVDPEIEAMAQAIIRAAQR